MNGIHIVEGDFSTFAKGVGVAADDLTATQSAALLDGPSISMPGSRSASTATQAGSAVKERSAKIVSALEDIVDAANSAEQSFAATESSTTAKVSAVNPAAYSRIASIMEQN